MRRAAEGGVEGTGERGTAPIEASPRTQHSCSMQARVQPGADSPGGEVRAGRRWHTGSHRLLALTGRHVPLHLQQRTAIVLSLSVHSMQEDGKDHGPCC
jgi:hypothetical protein